MEEEGTMTCNLCLAMDDMAGNALDILDNYGISRTFGRHLVDIEYSNGIRLSIDNNF